MFWAKQTIFSPTSLAHAASAARCQATAAGSVAAGSPSSSQLEAIRWGSAKLQGAREEMEDEVVLCPDSLLHGFFAAVLDVHAGFSIVQFLRDELYKECAAVLDGGAVLNTKNLEAIIYLDQGWNSMIPGANKLLMVQATRFE